MSYSIEFFGTDPDEKHATHPISNPFPTIDAAVAEATRIGPRRTATAALRILGRDHDRIDPFAARPSLQ